MIIIHIGWGFGEKISGGLDTHITHLTKGMAKKGHEIHLFLPKPNAPEKVPANITIHPIETAENHPTEDMIREYNRKIAEESTTLSPDIIHSHDWLGKEAAEQISKNNSIPWIHTVHSLEYMRSAEPAPKESAIESIERQAIERCTRIITVSALMKDEIIKHYNTPKEKISVIPNYTSMLPKPENITHHPYPTILSASRLSTQKGLEHLIYASRKIIERFPEARFIIAGSGDMEKPLKEFAEILGTEKSFTFTGHITDKELANLYASCDLFVMPSVWEPFGIALLDAVEAGIPVLASSTTGAAELFPESIATHEPSSSEDIAEKAIMLLEDKTRKRAKETFKTLDDWDKISEKTINVYASVRL